MEEKSVFSPLRSRLPFAALVKFDEGRVVVSLFVRVALVEVTEIEVGRMSILWCC